MDSNDRFFDLDEHGSNASNVREFVERSAETDGGDPTADFLNRTFEEIRLRRRAEIEQIILTGITISGHPLTLKEWNEPLRLAALRRNVPLMTFCRELSVQMAAALNLYRDALTFWGCEAETQLKYRQGSGGKKQ